MGKSGQEKQLCIFYKCIEHYQTWIPHGVNVPSFKRGILFVRSSSHAIRIRSTVAGESSLNMRPKPRSSLAAAIASLMAKKTDDDRKSGGSPMPFEE